MEPSSETAGSVCRASEIGALGENSGLQSKVKMYKFFARSTDCPWVSEDGMELEKLKFIVYFLDYPKIFKYKIDKRMLNKFTRKKIKKERVCRYSQRRFFSKI